MDRDIGARYTGVDGIVLWLVLLKPVGADAILLELDSIATRRLPTTSLC